MQHRDAIKGGEATTRTMHRDLIAAARRIRDAAADVDTTALHIQLCGLRSSLLDHFREEAGSVDEIRGSGSIVVADGQRRLIRFLDELIFASADAPHGCACRLKAVELEHQLRRQARLEHALLVRITPVPARTATEG